MAHSGALVRSKAVLHLLSPICEAQPMGLRKQKLALCLAREMSNDLTSVPGAPGAALGRAEEGPH